MERSKPTRFNGTTWKDLDEAPLALFSKPKVSITPLEWKTKQPCKAAIKYGVNMYNALCQESVEPCKFCAKIFSNKLDALVHNATHSTVSLKRSKKLKSRKNSVINNISLDLTNGTNGAKCNGHSVNAEKKERAKKSPLHDAACCPKDNSENVTITDGFRLPKPRDMSCYYKQMIKVRRPKTEANRDKAQGNPLVMGESSNKLDVLINCVADCKVNLEPMICDSDCQTLLQKTAEWTKSNANLFPPTFTTNNSSKSSKRTVETDDRTCIAPDILSSFTNECRVVLDNPLLNLPIPEAKVSNMEVVKPDRLLDSFTAECKVILGPQMIFDDDPSGGKLPSSSQLITEDLPAASADLSDDDEPLVNVLDLNDYSSLIKPLICYCTFCPQVFPNRFQLYKHHSSHLSIQFSSKTFVSLRPFSLLKEAAWNSPQEYTKTTKYFGIYCSVCRKSYGSVEDLIRHAEVHIIRDQLHPAVRYVEGERNPTFTACETCYRLDDKPRKLIGELVAEVPTVQCLLCNRVSLHARLFLGSRTAECISTQTPVIDLCDDEPEDGADTLRGSLNSGDNSVNSYVQNQVNSLSANVILCQAMPIPLWGSVHSDPEMATLIPNTVSNHNSNLEMLESILHPTTSDVESALVPNIISKNDFVPGAVSKKDFINTVWEHALTDVQNPVTDDNIPNTFVWGQANSTDIGNAARNNIDSTWGVGDSETEPVPRTGIKERITFEDDLVTNPKPVDRRTMKTKQKPGDQRLIKPKPRQSPKGLDRYTYKLKPKTITNADRLRNIKRNLQNMRAGNFSFRKHLKRSKGKVNECVA